MEVRREDDGSSLLAYVIGILSLMVFLSASRGSVSFAMVVGDGEGMVVSE